MKEKTSFGGGYGINRNVPAAKVLGTAVPPLSSITIKPGVKNSKKHFDGAKIYTNKGCR